MLIYLSIFIILSILPQTITGQRYNFKTFTAEDILAQSQVLTVYQDSKGYMWLGTNGGGVSRYDGVNSTILTTKDGLCNNTILSILEDKEGILWFGTDG